MKKDIHPVYYPKSKIACACGKKFILGSTREELRVEICSNCHPFYTGSQQLIDTAGRVERFKVRRSKAGPVSPKKPKVRIKVKKD